MILFYKYIYIRCFCVAFLCLDFNLSCNMNIQKVLNTFAQYKNNVFCEGCSGIFVLIGKVS